VVALAALAPIRTVGEHAAEQPGAFLTKARLNPGTRVFSIGT
jgi:hypothetical protein